MMNASLLIVDDNQSLANLYQIVFERSGWQTSMVGGGQEAIDSIAAERPDVVLLDVMMPGMDGVEVCRRIRDLSPSSPPLIVIYTANSRPETRQACLDAGADLFYSKSVSVFDLAALLTAHLSPPEAN